MSQIPRGGRYQKPNIVKATTSQTTTDPDTYLTLSTTNTSVTQVNPCSTEGCSKSPRPTRPQGQLRPPSGLRPPGQSRPPSQLRPPGQGLMQPADMGAQSQPTQLRPPSQMMQPTQMRAPTQMRPPSQLAQPTQLRPPSQMMQQPTQMRPPSQMMQQPTQLRPPSQMMQPTQMRPPSQMMQPTQLRAPSQLRPPGQLRPPTQLRYPGQMGPEMSQQESGVCEPCTGPGDISSAVSPSFQADQSRRQIPKPSRLQQIPRRASPYAPAAPAQEMPMPQRVPSPAPVLPPSGLQQPAFVPAEPPAKRITVPMDYQEPSGSRTNLYQPDPRPAAPRMLAQPSSRLQQPGIRPPSGLQMPSSLRQPTSRLRAPAQKPLEQEVRERLDQKALQQPSARSIAKGKRTANLPIKSRPTPAGMEQVLQEAVFEERVERDATGERIVKNVSVADLNERTGMMDQVNLAIQQLDPRYAKVEGREVIGVTSTVSVTASYKSVSKECLRVLTGPEGQGIRLSPEEIAMLIEEEKEDVDNTLKMVPPDLSVAPGKVSIKQRLHRLRLNSESMALLEQSIIRPEVTADEPQAEPNPEVMSSMMHTVERGITPQVAPDEVFNSLFQETVNEKFVHLSSVAPGPLQDLVVPKQVARDIHQEVLSEDMDKLCEKLENSATAEEVPYVDIFTRVMDEEAKSPRKGRNHPRSFQPITDEKSLWVNQNMEHLVHICGAEPAEVLDPWKLDELEESENLEKELSYGMDFFLECNPLQYVSRVQLRGTQQPSYFPGYMVALPDFPEIVKIARSPDEVFASAWKSVQPKYFPDDSSQSMVF